MRKAIMNQVDTPQSICRVGVARGDITPPVGIYHRMWGAAVHDRATGVHRPLLATLLLFEPAEGPRDQGQLIVALDHCILDSADMDRIRHAAGREVGIAAAQVHVALSHTHGSGWMSRTRSHLPGGELIGPYLDDLAKHLAGLARDAAASLRRATIVYGFGRCNLAAHRDYWDEQHRQFVCGFNPVGPADDTVLVGRVTEESGRTLASIVNYACHPTTLAWDNTALSPDYVGAMREVVERHTEAPCVFLQGASGDLGPREGYVGDWSVADRNGRQLGFAALSALEALPRAGTRYVYAGPVVSGATIGPWRHVPLNEASLRRQEAWRCERFTVELPYRHDLPTLAETESALACWQTEEAKAADSRKARDCRAMVEQMRRQIARLSVLPKGKTFPYVVNLWCIGEARWLFVPGELYQVFQVALRRRFPDLPLVIATVTGDWQPGYVPSASTYGYGIYQDKIAAVGPGALEVLVEAIARKLGAPAL
jgi:hypothetical protein